MTKFNEAQIKHLESLIVFKTDNPDDGFSVKGSVKGSVFGEVEDYKQMENKMAEMRIDKEKSCRKYTHEIGGKGWHVLFHEGRADFLEGIEDGGGIFHYYEGREDNLRCVDYQSNMVHFYGRKEIDWITEVPLWVREFDWRQRWVEVDYTLGEHIYEIPTKVCYTFK